MTWQAYGSIVIGSVLLALYSVFTKKTLSAGWKQREALLTTLITGTCAIMLFTICFATGGPKIKPGFWFPVIATGIFNIGIQYLNTLAKSKEEVSLVAPIAASTPVIIIFTSMVMLGEYPSKIGWVGIYLLVIGSYVLNMQPYVDKVRKQEGVASWKHWLTPFLIIGKSAGIRLAFGAAILGAISLNWDGLSSRNANVAFSRGIVWTITAVGSLVIALVKKEIPGSPISWKFYFSTICFLALLYGGCSWFNSSAYLGAIVPYVGTLKRLTIPLTIVFAYLLIGEKTNFRNRLTGGIIMAAGAVLVGIS